MTYPPQFFGKGGILLVEFGDRGTPRMLFYATRDASTTWQPTTPVQGTVCSFADPAHGWATDGKRLWVTRDGARTWRSLPMHLLLNLASQDVTQVGWLVAAAKDCTELWLFETTDGGATWRPVAGGASVR